MKTIYALLILAFFLLINVSCSDEDKIAAAISDGEELEEGSTVYFLLHQNYPNPFNPTTSIHYDIGKSMNIELEVFSEDWVKVATLYNRSSEPGSYEIQFNAEGLPSGEYFYTMTGDGVTQIRKMKLVK